MIVHQKKRKKRRPPFVIGYKAILRNPKYSLQCKAVLMILKSFANSDGTHCFPAIETLCECANIKRRSMTRHLAELKAAGLIFNTGQRTTKERKLSRLLAAATITKKHASLASYSVGGLLHTS